MKVLYVDMDNTLVNFQSGIDSVPGGIPAEFRGHEDDVPGIFALMEPMPGAIDAYRELAGLFDTYILSTAPWNNPTAWSDKLQWVQRHLGDVAKKRLILTHHKNLNCGDFIIDDRTRHGVDEFKGEHIHFGREPYTDWEVVVRYLRTRA